MNAFEIIRHFAIDGETDRIEPYGNGHINDTYLVTVKESDHRYILQRVNRNVFPHPEQVMENIVKVTEYLATKENTQTLRLVDTVDGAKWFTDDQDVWRVYRFVEHAISLDRPESDEDFFQSGVAFGRFQSMLKDFPAETLHETIRNFHNTPDRYQKFLKAEAADAVGRRASAEAEIAFVKEREAFYATLEKAHEEGKLPLRITHNDTKLNNVMLDAVTREPVCVIDLDTVMPGYSVNDFGDSIRFGASTAAEDEKDLSKVHFSLELFETYVKGYLKGCEGALTPTELEFLPVGAKMMTMECGMRFLTDYLEGDGYFKTAYPEHNLVRCRTQFQLVKEMEAHWDEMHQVVSRYSLGVQ
jgi:Ser/Thr protein kinase RdoA (MazF antagonist)